MTKHGTAPSALFCRRRRRAQFYAGGGAFTHRQPPLSQQIQALEAEVGAQLLERSKRWVRLTQAGALFLADARRILALSEQAVQTARRAQRGEAGELRIAYTYSTPFTPLFASVINRYRQRYPGVVLTLN